MPRGWWPPPCRRGSRRTTDTDSLWKEEVDPELQGPLGGVVRPHDVVVGREPEAHRLHAEAVDLADTDADRHGPPVVPVLLPVRRDVRHGGEEPAPRQVVVDDRLDQRLVDGRPVVVAGKGPT